MKLVKGIPVIMLATLTACGGGGGGGSSSSDNGPTAMEADFSNLTAIEATSIAQNTFTSIKGLLDLAYAAMLPQFYTDQLPAPGTYNIGCGGGGTLSITWTSPGNSVLDAGDDVDLTFNGCPNPDDPNQVLTGTLNMDVITHTESASGEATITDVIADITLNDGGFISTLDLDGNIDYTDTNGDEVLTYTGDVTIDDNGEMLAVTNFTGTYEDDLTNGQEEYYFDPFNGTVTSGGMASSALVTNFETFVIPHSSNFPTAGAMDIEGADGDIITLFDDAADDSAVLVDYPTAPTAVVDDWSNYGFD